MKYHVCNLRPSALPSARPNAIPPVYSPFYTDSVVAALTTLFLLEARLRTTATSQGIIQVETQLGTQEHKGRMEAHSSGTWRDLSGGVAILSHSAAGKAYAS